MTRDYLGRCVCLGVCLGVWVCVEVFGCVLAWCGCGWWDLGGFCCVQLLRSLKLAPPEPAGTAGDMQLNTPTWTPQTGSGASRTAAAAASGASAWTHSNTPRCAPRVCEKHASALLVAQLAAQFQRRPPDKQMHPMPSRVHNHTPQPLAYNTRTQRQTAPYDSATFQAAPPCPPGAGNPSKGSDGHKYGWHNQKRVT